MRYYKLINKAGYKSFEINKIYKGSDMGRSYHVCEFVAFYPNDWEEVSESEYLKQEGMNKEIIGYKLVNKDMYEAASVIIHGNISGSYGLDGVLTYKTCIEKLRSSGVLDLWFESVYKEEKSLPNINGYKGELKELHVEYGCAKFASIDIERMNDAIFKWNLETKISNRKIKSITLDSGVSITVEELAQINDYING